MKEILNKLRENESINKFFKFPLIIVPTFICVLLIVSSFLLYQLTEKKYYDEIVEIKSGDRILPILTKLYPDRKSVV